jgi:hypothetical protein
MTIQQIAELAHETNRVYCELIGDYSQLSWFEAYDWQRDSSILGVEFRLKNPEAPASSQHESWLKYKIAEGWKYGPIKDPEKKEHPCCVPYEELPLEQKIKDSLFTAIVETTRPLL